MAVVRRISISLGQGQYKALVQWSEKEGVSPTTLATSLLTASIRKEVEDGRLNPDLDTSENQPDIKDFLDRLARGELPTNGQLVVLAHDLGIRTEVLLELRDRVQLANKKGKSNGT